MCIQGQFLGKESRRSFYIIKLVVINAGRILSRFVFIRVCVHKERIFKQHRILIESSDRCSSMHTAVD